MTNDIKASGGGRSDVVRSSARITVDSPMCARARGGTGRSHYRSLRHYKASVIPSALQGSGDPLRRVRGGGNSAGGLVAYGCLEENSGADFTSKILPQIAQPRDTTNGAAVSPLPSSPKTSR